MENIKLFKPNEDEISQLSAYLWDDLNNLASGWNIKRSCESHNIVAFTIIYVSMGGKESIDDILCVEKHLLHKVINKYFPNITIIDIKFENKENAIYGKFYPTIIIKEV